MNGWQRVPNDHYPIPGLTTVEHAEFGRSTAEVFRDAYGKWEIVVDGQVLGDAADHDEALREAEIDAWDSEANTLFARRTRM